MILTEYNKLLKILSEEKYFIIDGNVLSLYPDISTILKNKKHYVLENAEDSKCFGQYEKICHFFLESGVSRTSKIICIGGGATTDLGGFVASTLLRGIDWISIPTTLLGMIDASIGGKVGINTELGKNLIGQFHLPKEVFICVEFLKSLSQKEIDSAYGELIKYTFLSKDIFDKTLECESYQEILHDCAEFKESVVAKDFKEGSIRKTLNLGHTFGHAFEKTLNIEHGKAVFLGLKCLIDVFEIELKEEFELIAKKLKLDHLVFEKADFNKFLTYMMQDKKKISEDEIEFILPQNIGEIIVKAQNIKDIEDKLKNEKIFQKYFY